MNRSVDYYLAHGYDQKAAEYFAKGRKRLTSVVPNPDFTLTLTYDGSEKRLYDMRPTLKKGGVFAHLRRWEDFRRVYIDDCHSIAWDIDPQVDSSVVWQNIIDLCPDSCYIDSVPLN